MEVSPQQTITTMDRTIEVLNNEPDYYMKFVLDVDGYRR